MNRMTSSFEPTPSHWKGSGAYPLQVFHAFKATRRALYKGAEGGMLRPINLKEEGDSLCSTDTAFVSNLVILEASDILGYLKDDIPSVHSVYTEGEVGHVPPSTLPGHPLVQCQAANTNATTTAPLPPTTFPPPTTTTSPTPGKKGKKLRRDFLVVSQSPSLLA